MDTAHSVQHGEVDTHTIHGHEEHHHEETFLTKYIFSQDHKMISKQFLITGIFWGIVGGLLSILFRLQLGWPNETFPFLETFLGRWAEGGKISQEFYYALITMHGTILVFFVLTGGLSGTFANLLIPYQIGSRDMASPFINMLSYWFFFSASCVMLFSFFIQTGPASGGWTAYPPLNGLRNTGVNLGSGLGFDMWALGMSLFIVSALLAALNYVSTVLNQRTKGMTMMRLPMTVWALMFTAIVGILSFPALLAGVVLLEFDRLLDTSFYLNNIIINGQLLGYKGGSPILFEHLFWFLGHPEVYIIILPAFGIVSEVLAVHTRKPIFGYKAMVYSIVAIFILSFIVWAHHMFVTGLNPNLGAIFTLFTLLIAIPSAIKVFNWIGTIWRGKVRLTSAALFSIGFVSMFISGGLTGIILGNSAIDIQLHDTMFVVAHFHIVMGIAAFFGMFSGVYHWFPRMYGRYMNETLGQIHFYITLVGAYCIFFPMHFMTGLPRRYYSYANFETFNNFNNLAAFMSVVAILVFMAQLLFVINFFYSIFKGRKLQGEVDNPWGANTLEWTAPVERLHGNWPGDIPTVYRWPYDYGNNGREFTPPNGTLETRRRNPLEKLINQMAKAISISVQPIQLIAQKMRDYAALAKLRLSFLVVFSAVIGYIFGVSGFYNLMNLVFLALGGMLVTGASNAINQVIERDIDKLMKRTQNRPLPAERMNMLEAVLAAGLMGVSGILIISWFFNPIAGVLSAISLLLYAFVYTPLKRVSPIAVFVGAIPGALPPMIGYVCATGKIDFIAVYLFSMQFLWQFPHFWAIAWVQFDDYQKAGIMLLPSASGKTRMSAIQNVIYCAGLLIVSVIPFLFHLINIPATIVISAVGLAFLWMAWNHYQKCEDKTARVLMFGSFMYLPVMQLALVLGKI